MSSLTRSRQHWPPGSIRPSRAGRQRPWRVSPR